jgi:fructokinase
VIVIAGEALIDLMPIPGQQHHFDARPGGAPGNVAVGLARLGRRAAFLGRISADPFGRLLRQHLDDAGVDTSMVIPAGQPTTLAVAALDGHGKAEYTFYAEGTADWQWTAPEVPQILPGPPRALYVGGLALRQPPGAAVLESLVRRTRHQGTTLVFFDPNVRTGFGFTADAERARVERQVRLAHVIKASEDDIALLYPDRDYREVAAQWQEMAPGLVAVTLGADGVYALAPGGVEMTVPGVPAHVVDTVGAGDAFAAAMLDSLVGLVGQQPADRDQADGEPGGPEADAGPGAAESGGADRTGAGRGGAGPGAAEPAGAGRGGAGPDAAEPAGAEPAGADPAGGLARLGAAAIRGLLERACVSAALTCEQAGAQSPDARTLDEATARLRRTNYGPAAGFEPAIPGP